MGLVDHIDLHQPVPTNWPGTTINPVIDALLDRLEHVGATTPAALALPVLLLHAAVSAIAYR